MRAIVGNEQRFISSEPSPSSAITWRRGRPSAMPSAIEEQSPRVRTRKFPSEGRSAFDSKVTAPAELTASASPHAAATTFKQSNLFSAIRSTDGFSQRLERRAPAENFLGQQKRNRPLGVFGEDLRARDQFAGVLGIAHHIRTNSQSLQHRL